MAGRSFILAAICIVMLFLLVPAAVGYLTTPSAPTGEKLAWACADKVKEMVEKMDAKGMKLATPAMEESGWVKIRPGMRAMGASPSELNGVVKAAKECFPKNGPGDCDVIGIPIYARKGRVKGDAVWVIGFAWGIRSAGSKTSPVIAEPPSHFRVLVIQARPPHKIIGVATCS